MSKKKIASLMLAFIMLASVCISPGIFPAVSAEMPETEPPVVTDATAPAPEETISLTPPEPEVTAPAESEAQIETETVEYVDEAETEPAESEQTEAATDAREHEEDLRNVSGQISVTAARTQFHAVKRLYKTETASASDTTIYLPNASYLMKKSATGATLRFGNFCTHEIKYNGQWIPAYCLDIGLGSNTSNLDGTIDNYSEWCQYVDNTAEGYNKKKAITLILAYSKKLLGSRTFTDWDYAAIQTLIWEIVSGRRESTWPYMTTGVDMFGQSYDNTSSYPGSDHISYNDANYPRARRPKTAEFFFFANGSSAYQYTRVYTYAAGTTQIAGATAFNNGRQLYTDIIRALTMHTIPSFAYTTSNDAAAEGNVKNLQWDGSKYTITLTDTKGVIAHYLGKSCPSIWTENGVTYSLSTSDGNLTQTLKISATDINAVNGITLSWQQDTLDFNSTDGALVFKPDNTNMQPTVFFDHAVPPVQKAYIKLAAPVSVSLKKTSQGSASVLAAIQGNPLYSLQGAVYEIHQGSATGPVVETLTTNANGEATGTQKYAIGTKLYAVEKTAPDGYLLNTTPVELTVSAGNTVFNVSDTPTFDPNRVVLNKTGTDTTRIKGAVFKFEFYADTWANPDRLLRTWYLKSDDTGLVKYDDAHLATGYNSDPIYKPNGTNPQFPLGCVVVKEVKTADGYVLPNDNDGKVFLFIKQREEDRSAYSFWGNGSGAPLTEQNPRGIYHIENDADPEMLTAINTEAYGSPFSIQKIDPAEAPLEGAVFRVDYFDDEWFNPAKLERTWYFKTDSNGYFTLENQYLADDYTSSELFPTDAIPVGIMRVREITAPEGYQLANITGIWRVKQAASGSSTVNSYWAAGNGETPTTSYGDSAYVLDAEPDKLYVKDSPIVQSSGSLKILKVDKISRTPLEGAGFRLFDAEGNQIAEGYTDQDGSLTFGDLAIGEYAYQEFEAPEGFVLDETLYPFSVTETNPDITIERENEIAEGSIRVRKLNEKGQPMAGVSFLLEYSLDDGENWLHVGYRGPNDPVAVGCCTNDNAVDGVIQTGADGWAEFTGLAVNNQLCNIMYRLTEVKTWDGYQLLTEPVFEDYLTDELSEVERTAVNHPTFQMPMTGSGGYTAAGIGLGLSVLAALLILLYLPKKREVELPEPSTRRDPSGRPAGMGKRRLGKSDGRVERQRTARKSKTVRPRKAEGSRRRET